MTRFVTNDDRYKRPKQKRKPVPLKVPAVVTRGRKHGKPAATPPPFIAANPVLVG